MKNFKDTEYYSQINYLINLLKRKYSTIKNIIFVKEEKNFYYFKCNNDIKIKILVVRAYDFIDGYRVIFENKINYSNMPHEIFFDESYLIKSEEFYDNEELKYETLYRYYMNGNLKEKLFFNNKGELHKEDGPALLEYNLNGELEKIVYYLEDKKYDEFQYLVKLASIEEEMNA